jgi:hypothetical protein
MLDFPNSMNDYMYALWKLFAEIVLGVEDEEDGVGSSVRNTEKNSILKGSYFFHVLNKKRPAILLRRDKLATQTYHSIFCSIRILLFE